MNFFSNIADTQIARRPKRPLFSAPQPRRHPCETEARAIARAAVREVLG